MGYGRCGGGETVHLPLAGGATATGQTGVGVVHGDRVEETVHGTISSSGRGRRHHGTDCSSSPRHRGFRVFSSELLVGWLVLVIACLGGWVDLRDGEIIYSGSSCRRNSPRGGFSSLFSAGWWVFVDSDHIHRWLLMGLGGQSRAGQCLNRIIGIILIF